MNAASQLSPGAMAGLVAEMASGVPGATALANAQQSAASAAAQIQASTLPNAGSPVTRLAGNLAGGGGNIAAAVGAALGGMASSPVALEAVQAALAGGGDLGGALASAAATTAAAEQQIAASTVPLTPAAVAVGSLSGGSAGNMRAALTSLTAGLNATQSAAFTDSLAAALASGMSQAEALAFAKGSADAAGQMLAQSAVPVSHENALVASLNTGIAPDKVLSALGVDGGAGSPAGQAALDTMSQAMARGDNPAEAVALAGAAAKAATEQIHASTVQTGEFANLAGGADNVAALKDLLAKHDSASPPNAAFVAALQKALTDGLAGDAAVAAAQAAQQAASGHLAASQVPTDIHGRLIEALATGKDVVAVAEATVPALAIHHVESGLLYRTLLKTLAEGGNLETATEGVLAQAIAADQQLAAAKRGVPAPDPQLIAQASGVPVEVVRQEGGPVAIASAH
ncbi:MAG: hypothetical protein WCF85_06180 [Rhodospirillaceae bacterium]